MKCALSRNGKGITHVTKDLSNPPISAWEARTLPLSYARSFRLDGASYRLDSYQVKHEVERMTAREHIALWLKFDNGELPTTDAKAILVTQLQDSPHSVPSQDERREWGN